MQIDKNTKQLNIFTNIETHAAFGKQKHCKEVKQRQIHQFYNTSAA